MRVKLLVGAEAAYVCINDDHGTLDVRLSAGHSAPDSLRTTAAEWRAEAARLIRRANRAGEAATMLDARP